MKIIDMLLAAFDWLVLPADTLELIDLNNHTRFLCDHPWKREDIIALREYVINHPKRYHPEKFAFFRVVADTYLGCYSGTLPD